MEKKELIDALSKVYGTTPEEAEKMLNIAFNDSLKVYGELRIRHFRKGLLLTDETFRQLVVNTGLEYYAKLINGVSTDPMLYGALGRGTDAAEVGDTALTDEITDGGGARAAMTNTYEASYKAKLVKTWSFTATIAVTEFGVFDAASAGNMSVRHVFTAKNVENGDSIEFTHKLTVAAA